MISVPNIIKNSYDSNICGIIFRGKKTMYSNILTVAFKVKG